MCGVDTWEHDRRAHGGPGAISRQIGDNGASRLKLVPELEIVAQHRAAVETWYTGGSVAEDGPRADVVQGSVAAVVHLHVNHGDIQLRHVLTVLAELTQNHIRQSQRPSTTTLKARREA